MGVWLNPSQVRSCCEPPKLPFRKERQTKRSASGGNLESSNLVV